MFTYIYICLLAAGNRGQLITWRSLYNTVIRPFPYQLSSMIPCKQHIAILLYCKQQVLLFASFTIILPCFSTLCAHFAHKCMNKRTYSPYAGLACFDQKFSIQQKSRDNSNFSSRLYTGLYVSSCISADW